MKKMNQLLHRSSLKNNRSKSKTSRNLPIFLEESMECTSKHWRNPKTKTCKPTGWTWEY